MNTSFNELKLETQLTIRDIKKEILLKSPQNDSNFSTLNQNIIE